MKREILCPACIKEFLVLVGGTAAGDVYTTTTKYPGEYVRAVAGRSLVECMCDHCGVDLKAGVLCWAMTIFTDKLAYFPWEDAYLQTEQRQSERR